MLEVPERSVEPKFKPATTTVPQTELGIFRGKLHDVLGTSNEKSAADVPRTAPTVIARSPHGCGFGGCWNAIRASRRQRKLVADTHAEVVHISLAFRRVAVKSYKPKFRPVTVTDGSPLTGKFCKMDEATGASNVSRSSMVPASAATVTSTVPLVASATALLRHATEVPEVHDAVWHNCMLCESDAEKSSSPKLRPVTVTDEYPLAAEFSRPLETTGASKLRTAELVPATPPTVTTAAPPSRTSAASE